MLIETSIVPDADGNSKNDRYRASKMKVNEEYIIVCSLDMRNLVNNLYKQYEDQISLAEIEYYRRNMKPSRLQQWLIEIYFFNYTDSSQEFALLRNLDWYKLLLIIRCDIMKRLSIDRSMILDSVLPLILTANIEETPLPDKIYLKDTKYLKDNETYQMLATKYYANIISMNEDIIKKFLLGFANSRYTFVLYEEPGLLGQEVSISKRLLIDELLTFLLLSNTSMSIHSGLECAV